MAKIETEEAEAAEIEEEDDTAGMEKWMMDSSVGVVYISNLIKRHSCDSPCIVGLSEPVPEHQDHKPPSACTLEPEPMPELQPHSACAQDEAEAAEMEVEYDTEESHSASSLEPEPEPEPMPPELEPPAGKMGFKGKRATKKFGRYSKRCGKQKPRRSSLLLKTEQVLAIESEPDNNFLAITHTMSHQHWHCNKIAQQLLAERLPRCRSFIDSALSQGVAGKCRINMRRHYCTINLS